MNLNLNKKIDGFTLTELLVVLVIVGILVLLALPNFMGTVSDARAKEAQLQLKHLYTLQKNYFMMHTEYANDIDATGFEQVKLADDGGTAYYQIEMVEASQNGFKARARATRDFDGDGQFNIWEIDHEMNLEEVQKD